MWNSATRFYGKIRFYKLLNLDGANFCKPEKEGKEGSGQAIDTGKGSQAVDPVTKKSYNTSHQCFFFGAVQWPFTVCRKET